MASPTRWAWVWASSRSWRWIGKPGVLLSMGSQRVGHNWASELNFKKINLFSSCCFILIKLDSAFSGHEEINGFGFQHEVKWKSLSPVWLFTTPWTIQSMEFSRPEYRSGQLFPSPRDLPNPGIEPRFPA